MIFGQSQLRWDGAFHFAGGPEAYQYARSQLPGVKG